MNIAKIDSKSRGRTWDPNAAGVAERFPFAACTS